MFPADRRLSTWIRNKVPVASGPEPEVSDDPGGEAEQLPANRLDRAVATMDPGYFAAVMATGIVSIGTDLLGHQILSQVTLGFAVAAFAVLTVAYGWRVIRLTPWFRRSLKDPTTAMAYFTVVAGADVLATRLAMSGHPLVTLVLAGVASVLWVLLTYGLPWSIVAAARRPVLGEINGTWLIWVVATQSLAIVSALLATTSPARALRYQLPVVAICLWSVVFPLGMYTVASDSLGRTTGGLGFMATVARTWVFVGFGAWAMVLALLIAGQLSRRLRHFRRIG